MSRPEWLKAGEELRDDMAVVLLAPDILPAAYEAQSRSLVAIVVTSSAAAAVAVVVRAVGPPLRSRRVWVEVGEVALVAEEGMIDAAPPAWCHTCPDYILQLPAVAIDSMDSTCVSAWAQPIDRGLGERTFGIPGKLCHRVSASLWDCVLPCINIPPYPGGGGGTGGGAPCWPVKPVVLPGRWYPGACP